LRRMRAPICALSEVKQRARMASGEGAFDKK
jgi:hypothetical protein